MSDWFCCSKTVADLKVRFPSLQEGMKGLLASEMEKVVREEKWVCVLTGMSDAAVATGCRTALCQYQISLLALVPYLLEYKMRIFPDSLSENWLTGMSDAAVATSCRTALRQYQISLLALVPYLLEYKMRFFPDSLFRKLTYWYVGCSCGNRLSYSIVPVSNICFGTSTLFTGI